MYTKGLGDGSLESISEAISHPKARVAGLVVDKVDKIKQTEVDARYVMDLVNNESS